MRCVKERSGAKTKNASVVGEGGGTTEAFGILVAQGGARFEEGGAGSDLLSHSASTAVPSAQESLTTEFGLGSGGASPLGPPA